MFPKNANVTCFPDLPATKIPLERLTGPAFPTITLKAACMTGNIRLELANTRKEVAILFLKQNVSQLPDVYPGFAHIS